jgi:hypothetical protein
MSTDESPESPLASTGTADDPLDAETAAGRALGIAMNSVWGGAKPPSLPNMSARLVADAQAVLRERTPAGRERDMAIELLARCALPVRSE